MEFNKEMFDQFKMGDKVSLVKINLQGNAKQVGKGTITKITEKTITVRQYRKKTKGWNIGLGKDILLAHGWDNDNLNELIFKNNVTKKIGEYTFVGNLDIGKMDSYKNDQLVDEVWKGTMRNNKDEFERMAEKMCKVLIELEEQAKKRKSA